jgi:hypothetical protein
LLLNHSSNPHSHQKSKKKQKQKKAELAFKNQTACADTISAQAGAGRLQFFKILKTYC